MRKAQLTVVALLLVAVLLPAIGHAPSAQAATRVVQVQNTLDLKLAVTYLGPEVVISGTARSATGVPDINVVVEQVDAAGPPIFDGPATTALLPPPGDPGAAWRVPLNLAVGNYRVTVTSSIDDDVLQQVIDEFAVVDETTPPLEIIARDADWSYYDAGDEPSATVDPVPVNWFEPGYGVTTWASGPAELGYGDDDEATTTAATNAVGQKILAQYFRHEFSVGDLSDYDVLTLTMLRDDGAIVYLNGVELGRTNMPGGAVSYGTFASSVSEQTITIDLAPEDLVAGVNLLAVEVHQSSTTSSDISFSASLAATELDGPKLSNATAGTFVLAAGDMARCNFDGDEAVAAQMSELFTTDSGVFIGLGDLVYNSGTIDQFVNCYDPTIGQFRDVTWPSPGNHEHLTAPNAAGYRQYFGAAAGPTAGPSGGLWYSFDVDDYWHVIALDSDCNGSEVLPGAVDGDGCAVGSVQEQWLRADLEANQDKNILAFFHHPPYTNNQYTDHARTFPLWRALAEYGTELTLHGHEHHYERYSPLDYWGEADPLGTTEIIIGSGGTNPRYNVRPAEPESAFRGTFPQGTNDFGVLQLWLRPDGYEWKWQSIYGLAATDSGTGALTPPMDLAPITGVIRTEFSQEPLVSARVCATADRTGVESCVITAGDGSYELPRLVSDFYVFAVQDTAGQYATANLNEVTNHQPPTATTFDINMIPRPELSGMVTSATTGQGIANATICAQNVDDIDAAPRCANSSADGSYLIDRLDPFRSHQVSFESTGFVRECYDDLAGLCGTGATLIDVATFDISGIDAALAVSPGGITGAVTDEDTQAPITGVLVCADSSRLTQPACDITGSNGLFEIDDLPSSNYAVSYDDPTGRYESECFRARSCDRPLLVGVIQPGVRVNINASLVPVPTPTPTATATAPPSPTATATPEVTATSQPTPTPIPTETPTATPVPTSTPEPTATGTPSATATPVPSATATPIPTATATPVPTSTATPNPTATPTATPVPTASPTPVPTVDVVPGAVQGRVTILATGDPIFGAEVCARRSLPAATYCVFSDIDGRFSIENLDAGNYSVEATDPVGRYLPNCSGNLPCDTPFLYGVSANQGVVSVDIGLDPLYNTSNPTPTPTPFVSEEGFISGRVTTGGVAASGVEVCAVATFTSITSCAISDASGSYIIEGLRTGNYRVEFNGAAVCYRNRVGCVSFTPVGLASPGGRTNINADLG